MIGCTDCEKGFFSNRNGQSTCFECAVGTFSAETKSTTCSRCSFDGLLPCQECNSSGDISVIDGFCLAQGKCYYPALSTHSIDLVTSLDHERFENSTRNFGCQFCSAHSPEILQNMGPHTPCPGKKCGIEENHEFVCLNGQCSMGRQCSAIKECYECRNARQGCEIMENHCELPDGACGSP